MPKKKYNVLIWGIGKWGQIAFDSLDTEKAIVKGVIDKSTDKKGRVWNNFDIYSLNDLRNIISHADYLIICMRDYYDALKYCEKEKIEKKKIIVFVKDNLDNYGIFKKKELDQYFYDRNLAREVYKEYETQPSPVVIRSQEDCLNEIISGKKSLSRFGDGEFEMILNRKRPWFQEPNEMLANRLKNVLTINDSRLLIALPNQFASLEEYSEEAKDGIRLYMSRTRSEILDLIDKKRAYYDAYVSRPYIIYKEKNNAEKIFNLWKEVWKDRKIVIVEGKNVRNGVNNDLFEFAVEIERVICPYKNAFDKIELIEQEIREKVSKDKLILITLGPTATIIAADLALEGYQAIDLGQLDNEYEWYLAKATHRISVKGKAVAELGETNVEENCLDNKKYKNQIISDLS